MYSYRKQNASEHDVRIVGLTGSIVTKKCDLVSFRKNVQKLTDVFDCQIETSTVVMHESSLSSAAIERPTLRTFACASDASSNNNSSALIVHIVDIFIAKVASIDDQCKERLLARREKLIRSCELSDASAADADPGAFLLANGDTPFRKIKNELSNLKHVLLELGAWSLAVTLPRSLAHIQSLLVNYAAKLEESAQRDVEELVKSLHDVLLGATRRLIGEQDEQRAELILKFSSAKVNCLLRLLAANNAALDRPITIVFVERKFIAFHLNKILVALSSSLDEWRFVKSDYLFSYTGGRGGLSLRNDTGDEKPMSYQKQVGSRGFALRRCCCCVCVKF